jgi:hypothetical protein
MYGTVATVNNLEVKVKWNVNRQIELHFVNDEAGNDEEVFRATLDREEAIKLLAKLAKITVYTAPQAE